MKHRIAAIPGDGIGKEVVPEGMRVLDAAGRFKGRPADDEMSAMLESTRMTSLFGLPT